MILCNSDPFPVTTKFDVNEPVSSEPDRSGTKPPLSWYVSDLLQTVTLLAEDPGRSPVTVRFSTQRDPRRIGNKTGILPFPSVTSAEFIPFGAQGKMPIYVSCDLVCDASLQVLDTQLSPAQAYDLAVETLQNYEEKWSEYRKEEVKLLANLDG